MRFLNRNSLRNVSILLFALFTVLWADNVLIIRSDGDAFREVSNSIINDIKDEFNVSEEIVDKVISIKKMKKLIEANNPDLVVLMNNKAVKSYKEYQQSLAMAEPKIPSLSLMTALLSTQIKGMQNAAGISYEVPIVTSVVNLRSILGIEEVKIGVVYREFLKDFIDENAEYCKKENVSMVRGFVPTDNQNYRQLLQSGLDLFTSEKHRVNMIWVPNDPVFLDPETIRDVWLPFSEKHSIPIIVGVESMLKANVNFGTYAVLPDHIALGNQAAELIRDIRSSGWKVDFTIVEPPISIYQVMNPQKIQKRYNLESEKLDVDKVIH